MVFTSASPGDGDSSCANYLGLVIYVPLNTYFDYIHYDIYTLSNTEKISTDKIL